MAGAPTAPDALRAPTRPTFSEALRFWLRLGLISFGGPTGQIAMMHAELVEKRRWISETRFLHALNYCMLLPGPEAQQLCVYIGWLLHRTWGGVVAGSLFVLPSVLILWALSYVYVTLGAVPWIAAVFAGLKPAVVAIVAAAVVRIGKRALKNAAMWTIAAAAFAALFFLGAPFPLIIVSAGVIGLLGGRVAPGTFVVLKPHGAAKSDTERPAAVIDDHDAAPDHARPTLARAVRVTFACLALWWTPVLAAAYFLGGAHAVVQQGVFFSKAAMVTFGGAYAVLPYVAQKAVEEYAWLEPGQMLDGLGLAETTPGPLIMVLQFVGFLGGWRQPGQLSPLLSATFGALITTWVTFLPCFLWIFLGAPYIEQLRDNRTLTAALSAITAAVVGVVLNLAVWFAAHVLLTPAAGVDWFALSIALVALAGIIVRKWDMLAVIAAASLIGLMKFALV